MRVILVVAAAAAAAWFTYWRLEQLGRRGWIAALCRAIAWAALGVLLLDLTCAVKPGPGARPLVLLDGSLSMAAAGGRWQEARDSARAWGEVRLFGERRAGADSLPTLGRSDLGPAIAAAAASDRPVIVVTDGELDDAADLAPEALARVGVRLLPRVAGPDLAIQRVRGPDRVTAGDTIRLEAEVRAYASEADSARVEVRLDQKLLARRALRLGRDGAGTAVLTFPSAGLSGDLLFRVSLAGPGDREPRDDARLWRVRVTPTPGVVLVASPPDWDARYLFRTLREVGQLPVRGYARFATGWRAMETLAPVAADEVSQAVRRADVLVVKGRLPEGVREARARGRWLWPSGEGGETVIPGEWYVSAPSASPVAGAFVGQPVDSFPPLLEITPIEAGSGEWVGLNAQLGRRGADRPILIGGVRGGTRQITTAAEGLWRWAFRGGTSEQAYRALVAQGLSWLLGAADSAGGKARPVRPVVGNGRPVVFEWSGGGSPEPLGIQLQGEGESRRDTLRFDGAGRAELWLPVGVRRYQLDGGGTGVIAVDTWSEEWLPRPVTIAEKSAPAVTTAGFTSSRRWIWLFGLAVFGLLGEWVVRRQLGLR
ncbi:MAG TPA: hypothetical protein VG692_07150 [Gemmatimonadales bacterium]|nr:hypothetical protein [Gemmatimonadales bacterium]